MSDEPPTDRHDRVTARLDALEASQRRGLAETVALRAELDALSASHDDDRRGLQDVRQEVTSLRAGQDALADQVGSMRVEQRGLMAQVTALSSRIPTGGAVVVAGSAAGVPGLVLLAVEVARYWASS